jgi:tRNA/tmRNA/rRNA uracil-C5-methylase (TrmA/RlmC/RlmD family)
VIVEVERVAHGGICVAHAPDGRVVFVRHTLPGEQVRVEVTEERPSFIRADAVEVLRPAAARVTPPCPWSGPGRCGGCDWQHVSLEEQRRLKATVVAEQLQRLAGVERAVVVEPVAGDSDGLHWRTRMRLATDEHGRAGLRRHRSHVVVPIDDCLIAAPAADVPALVERTWPPDDEVAVDVSSTGERALSIGRHDEHVTERAAGREWAVPVGGFWQVHPGAADVLAATVVELGQPAAGERWLDLYAGVGLFAGVLADHGCTVVAVESDRRAARAARTNVAEATVVTERVDRWVARPAGGPVDGVVLDPPRKGAGAAVVRGIAARGPRVIVYVACDPAALARDVATLADAGYRMTDLRAFDLFPMTAHVESVALFSAQDDAACFEAAP